MLIAQNFGFSHVLELSDMAYQHDKPDGDLVLSWCELKSREELHAFMDYLSDAELINLRSSGTVRLTSKGFDKLDALDHSSLESNQAFVAMWFADEMQEAYDSGFADAIKEAGYRPLRIDAKEHNNKIDDEIILEIRRSRFVVADFTCPVLTGGDRRHGEARGGVYFEAGLSHGLGIEVIWTVRKDCLEFVHFDTRQFSHIVWERPDELKSRLRDRIGATIGLRS